MEFDPASGELHCEYCGGEQPDSTEPDAVRERDLREHLRQAVDGAERVERLEISCGSCGARTTFEPNITADRCPFCDVHLIASPVSVRLLKPSAMLPFRISRDDEEGLDLARERMDTTIRSSVRADIGGDHQRILSPDTGFAEETFKHILLPLWLSAYRFGKRTFRFLVNARTGEVQGDRPWSWVKITLAALAVIATAVAAAWLAS